MKLLIIGASGLLGSKLSKIAQNENFDIYSVYNKTKPPFGAPIQLNIINKKALDLLFQKVKPEVVIHTAALTNVDKCEKEKKIALKINAEATKNIAVECKKQKSFLIYVSTDYVFNGNKGLYTENDVPDPINYYGYTKLKGEEHIQNNLSNYCIARTSVIYGAAQATGKINFALWLLNKLKKNEKVTIVKDQWNSPTLNKNLAEMILEIIKKGYRGIYHLSGATRIDRYSFCKILAQNFNLDTTLIEPIYSKDFVWKAKRPKDSSLNTQKAVQTLSKTPFNIEQSINALKKDIESQY